MPTAREILWSAWLNKLAFCYGCGRFGLPRGAPPVPRGWTVLYQPHPDGPPGLHVCSEACAACVREAMQKGPVVEPLAMMTDFGMMPADVRESWEQHLRDSAGEVLGEVTAASVGGIHHLSQKERNVEEAEGVCRLVPSEAKEDLPLEQVHPHLRLGEALRRVRIDANALTKNAALAINVAPADLAEIEQGERQVTADQIRELLVYYNCPERTDEFLVYAQAWFRELYSEEDGVVADGAPEIKMGARILGGRSVEELDDLATRQASVLAECRAELQEVVDTASGLIARLDEVLPAPEPEPDDRVEPE